MTDLRRRLGAEKARVTEEHAEGVRRDRDLKEIDAVCIQGRNTITLPWTRRGSKERVESDAPSIS